MSFNESLLPARRRFLKQTGLGFGSLALASLLRDQQASAAGMASDPLATRPPLYAPKAKAVIWLFMTGAPRRSIPGTTSPNCRSAMASPCPGAIRRPASSPRAARSEVSLRLAQHGQSGTWVSDIFPHLSQHVDRMAFIHSMYLKANNHAPASLELMCGHSQPGHPSAGAWLTYGLGAETAISRPTS